MALLSKEQILNSSDSSFEDVEVTEWGGTVRVQTMSGFARDRFESSIINNGKFTSDNIRAKLVAACLIDENGKLMFSEKEVVALGNKSCKALDKVFEVAQRLNGIGDSEVEQLAKN